MTVEADLFTALKSLVGNRMSPNTFPQPPAVPTWPAIRYTLSSTPVVDLCGDGTDATAEQRVQLDLVATTFDAVRTLRLSVLTAMKTFTPPAILDTDIGTYDVETKTHRVILQYQIHGST